MINDLFKKISKKEDKNDSARVAAREALKLFEEKAVKGLNDDSMSDVQRLIKELQKLDEEYSEIILDSVFTRKDKNNVMVADIKIIFFDPLKNLKKDSLPSVKKNEIDVVKDHGGGWVIRRDYAVVSGLTYTSKQIAIDGAIIEAKARGNTKVNVYDENGKRLESYTYY